MTFTSKSKAETQEIAEKILDEALGEPPVVFALYGELGAGKTTFAKAIAKILGVKEEVHSPTFLLICEYDLPKLYKNIKHLVHVDAYRIDDPTELSDLGLEKLMKQKNSLVVIEWADRVESLLPKAIVKIKFEIAGEDERKILITP